MHGERVVIRAVLSVGSAAVPEKTDCGFKTRYSQPDMWGVPRDSRRPIGCVTGRLAVGSWCRKEGSVCGPVGVFEIDESLTCDRRAVDS